MAHNAKIFSHRIAFGAFKYDTFELIQAFKRAKESGIKVINCSWVLGTTSYALEKMIRQIIDSNIAVVCAAGNTGTPLPFPAKMKGVFTVGAVNQLGTPKKWETPVEVRHLGNDWACNYGNNILLSAPGHNLFTTDLLHTFGERGNYLFFSKTSAAAPVISAAICIAFGMHPHIQLKELRTLLEKSVKAFRKKDQRMYGTGLFNFKMFYHKLKIYKP